MSGNKFEDQLSHLFFLLTRPIVHESCKMLKFVNKQSTEHIIMKV